MKNFGKVPYERYGLYVGTAANEQERQQRHDEVVENSRREMQRILAGTPRTNRSSLFLGPSICTALYARLRKELLGH